MDKVVAVVVFVLATVGWLALARLPLHGMALVQFLTFWIPFHLAAVSYGRVHDLVRNHRILHEAPNRP